MKKHLGFISIVGCLLVCGYAGLNNGQKSLGWIEFTKKNYEAAAAHFSSAGDHKGLGMVALARHRLDDADAAFAAVGDERGLGLVACHRHQFGSALAHFENAGDHSGRDSRCSGCGALMRPPPPLTKPMIGAVWGWLPSSGRTLGRPTAASPRCRITVAWDYAP